MKKVKGYLLKHKVFFAFLFVFSWVFTLKNKIGFASSWDNFVFHPDTSFWVFFDALFIFVITDFVQKRVQRNSPEKAPSLAIYLKYFGISLICYLLLKTTFGLLIATAFDNFSRNFGSSHQVTYRIFQQLIDFIIIGGFSLAYLFSRENSTFRQRITEQEILSSRSKIQQLKAQLNPHFLFNNLNILDQLIYENQDKASEFLGNFSELYRYTLNYSDKELTSIQEELQFIENYFVLMESRYENCYRLVIQEEVKTANLFVPPFCLQVLIENAIVHNLATEEEPVTITISEGNGLQVHNNIVRPNTRKKGNGVALKNLNKQFVLLTNQELTIQTTEEHFTVILPPIKNRLG